MLGFTRRVITVTFTDELNGQPISTFKMPLERLPETFVVDSELNMGGARYVVVRAEPPTKVQFSGTRQLKVFVRRRVAP